MVHGRDEPLPHRQRYDGCGGEEGVAVQYLVTAEAIIDQNIDKGMASPFSLFVASGKGNLPIVQYFVGEGAAMTRLVMRV